MPYHRFVLDLRVRPPRSPRARLGPYLMLPRTLDKCRAHLAGVAGEYQFDAMMDRFLFTFKEVGADAFKAAVARGLSDDEMLAWFSDNGVPRTDDEARAWSADVERYSLSCDPTGLLHATPARAAYIAEACVKFGLDPMTTPVIDRLEIDDAHSFPTHLATINSPNSLQARARLLLDLHHRDTLLILPNVWDPLGARMLAGLGYPAVATASAAIAFAHGYDDGERLRFDTMLAAIGRIAGSVSVPVTADIERGYARTPEELRANARKVFEAGIVGVNLEGSIDESGPLRPLDEQCVRIRAVIQAGEDVGISPVINARCDAFLIEGAATRDERFADATVRGKAYAAAGASCFYPILLEDLESLRRIRAEVGLPINALARRGAPSLADLHKAGVARVSLGPAVLRAAFTTMRGIAASLLARDSYEPFTEGVATSAEIRPLLSTGIES